MFIQIRDLEVELEEERKQRNSAVNSRKKVESEVSSLQQQLETANKLKDDGLKQMKKMQVN